MLDELSTLPGAIATPILAAWNAKEDTAMSQALCSVEAASGGAVSAAWPRVR